MKSVHLRNQTSENEDEDRTDVYNNTCTHTTMATNTTNKEIKGTPDMNKRMNQHGHIKCCKWVPWQHLDGSWFALYFHRQRNIKFSLRSHILYWYNKINLLVVPKARPLRKQFQKSSCLRHENSIVGMDPMATHCRKLIVTGIYQVKSYMSYLQQYTKIIKKLTLKTYFS